jgi:surfactin synthase thioesterase subunit
VADLLSSVELRPPFLFFGHSMGALIAYEVAHELRQSGAATPDWLFASAYAAPHLPRARTGLHELPDEELLPHLLAGYGDIPDELLADEEYLREVIGCHRADLRVVETYVDPRRDPLDRPITVLGGWDDDGDVAELAAWGTHTTGRFELHMLPGDHFYLRPERDTVLRLVAAAALAT